MLSVTMASVAGDGIEIVLNGVNHSVQIDRRTGDFNNDGQVSIGDLAVLVKYYGMTSDDPNWEQAKMNDLNTDGAIDILDLAMLAKMILN